MARELALLFVLFIGYVLSSPLVDFQVAQPLTLPQGPSVKTCTTMILQCVLYNHRFASADEKRDLGVLLLSPMEGT